MWLYLVAKIVESNLVDKKSCNLKKKAFVVSI